MRVLALVLALTLAFSSGAFAQSPQGNSAGRPPGSTKTWIGVGLLTAGLLMATVRATPPTEEDDRIPVIGAMTGGTLIFLGQRDKMNARAHHPTTKVGVTLGPRPTVQFQRTW